MDLRHPTYTVPLSKHLLLPSTTWRYCRESQNENRLRSRCLKKRRRDYVLDVSKKREKGRETMRINFVDVETRATFMDRT